MAAAVALLVSSCTEIEPQPSLLVNADGTVDLPRGYRQWVNVGTAIFPAGTLHIIDLEPTASAEALDTYVEPTAFAAYMASGQWPEGAQLVKEFTALSEPSEEDGSIAETHYMGLSYIIKDSTIFPAETGHLGYFQFGHQPEPYEPRASLMPRDRCSACHEKYASDQQFIFADRHISLARDRQAQDGAN